MAIEEIVDMMAAHKLDDALLSLLLWGMASGIGFGIAEGIMYSGRYYNGVAGADIHYVRFLSCVALHAIHC
jgi:hypothetical protein